MMNIYIYIILFIISLSFILNIIIPIKNRREVFLFLTFIVLFIVSAFRVEVGIDFINYSGTFRLANQTNSLSELYSLSSTSTVEMGYLLLNKLVGLFTNERQWIFVVTSFIIISLIYKGIKENSKIIWLSVFLFSIGPYVASFNIVRQYIAVSIFFYAYKYIESREFNKFLLCIILASFFHVSALLMLPLYYFLNIKLDYKKLIIISFSGIIVSFFINDIIRFIQQFFYGYYSNTSYGMTSGNINNVITATFYFACAYIFKNNMIKENDKNVSLINMSFVNLLLALMSMNTWIITRFMPYTSIFNILLIPEIIASVRNKYIRILFIFTFIILFLILFFNTIYNPANKLLPYQFYIDNL